MLFTFNSAKGGSYSRTSFSVNKFEKITSRYKSHNRTDLLWLLADNKPCLGPVVILANFCSLGFLGRFKFHEGLSCKVMGRGVHVLLL